MEAAKRKTFGLWIVALACVFSMPIFASSVDVLQGKTRAELSAENGQNSVERSPFYHEKHVENYDVGWGTASDSPVAPKSGLLDEILDGTRPVSGHTGFKNSARLNRSALTSLKLQAKELGATFVKNADDFFRKQGLGDKVRGAFDYVTGTVYLRKGATAYEAFHEMAHARHWAAIGREAYEGLGKYARESHVFNEIWKNRSQFSKAELQHAIDYMRDLRELHRLGRID